jgi:hypothetical protein
LYIAHGLVVSSTVSASRLSNNGEEMVVFESGPSESLVRNLNALRLPINIDIGRSRPLTNRMWEQLFREMNQAALNTDMSLYELMVANAGIRDRDGFDYIRRQTDRFVITSVERGSLLVAGAVFLAAAGGWFFKEFIKPGWEKSATKKGWDDGVASVIDGAAPVLKDQIDFHVVHRLKRLKIRRVTLRPPSEHMGHQLADNTTPDVELIYDKPKQITHKKESPH